MFGLFKKKPKPIDRGEPIVVVSGLPRSGTSMAMKMLDAAGFQPIEDGKRTADDDNPKGYYEDERVMQMNESLDRSWLFAARGKAIKIISYLLKELPGTHHYKIVFMRRNLEEVLASQNKMLVNRGEENPASDEEMKKMYLEHLEEVYKLISDKDHFEMVEVEYGAMVNTPETEAQKLNDFFGGGLDVAKMTSVVDRKLYRNRAS